jgi:adenylate cyclase
MAPRLILHPGRHDEQVFSLAKGSATIGRAEDNDVVVLAKTLSRYHARLDLTDGGALVTDLGSRNGTFVGDERLGSEPRRLGASETIRCGSVLLRFVGDGDSDTAEESSVPRLVQDIHGDLSQLSMAEVLGASRRTTPAEAQERLRILLKVSQLLSSPTEVDALLQKILDLAFEILDIDRGALLLVDETTRELVPRVVRTRAGVPESGAIYSQHIVRHVREHSVAALFADARSDPRLGEAKSILKQSICASMCAPLKPRDEVLGVLYVDNLSVPDRFDAEDLEFLSAFANQAAVALDNSYLYQRLEREAVARNNLVRFFPPATVRRLMEESDVGLEAQETVITALFCDLSDFTGISARLTPRQVVDLLNAYFPAMAEVVFHHDGTLEKYIGDALLAVWGAPFRHPEDADRAVQAAGEMQRALATLNRRRPGPELAIHVGLNTGAVAAGNIGSEHYLQYATIGDATNVASRICDAAAPGEVLLSESTVRHLRLGWPLEEVESRQVKGKEEPLRLYRLRWRQEPE